MTNTDHQPEAWFWEAESDGCPHGPEPEDDTTDAWDEWSDRHTWTPQDVRVCLDAPAGDMCGACSEEHGEGVPWPACRTRAHARPAQGQVPNPDAEHQPVTVWVGTEDCFERECEEYVTEDGDDDPAVEVCSHIRAEVVCSCQRQDDEYSTDTPCSAAAVSA